MNILIALFLFLNTLSLTIADEKSEVKILARIEKTKHSLTPLDKKVPGSIPFQLENKKLEKVISDLKPNEDVLLEGYISQQKVSHEDRMSLKPIFIISNIKPISLEKIGQLGKIEVSDPQVTLALEPSYAPKNIKISDKVFASLTITASILLLKGLTNGRTNTRLEEDSENLMIFSVGALATGTQVFEDLARKK